jgi:hypothetical protein
MKHRTIYGQIPAPKPTPFQELCIVRLAEVTRIMMHSEDSAHVKLCRSHIEALNRLIADHIDKEK